MASRFTLTARRFSFIWFRNRTPPVSRSPRVAPSAFKRGSICYGSLAPVAGLLGAVDLAGVVFQDMTFAHG